MQRYVKTNYPYVLVGLVLPVQFAVTFMLYMAFFGSLLRFP